MRALALVAIIGSLTAISIADARPARTGRTDRTAKRVAVTGPAKAAPARPRDRSIGAPWDGKLVGARRLEPGEGYLLRRPARTYATRTTVQLVRQAIRDTRDAYPKAHVLAIGDLSAETGGWISDHASHQSGRDVDLGLFYKTPPDGYPEVFVKATARTLHAGATWTLVSYLARTADEDGGVQYIFLDQGLQKVLYAWAEKAKISERRIKQVQRVLRHEPNHADHLHVRFACRARDTSCR